MKMTKQDFSELSKYMQDILDANPTAKARYIAGDFPRSEHVKDLNVRFRWDIFYHARNFFSDTLKENLRQYKDVHIETALKKIVPNIV